MLESVLLSLVVRQWLVLPFKVELELEPVLQWLGATSNVSASLLLVFIHLPVYIYI